MHGASGLRAEPLALSLPGCVRATHKTAGDCPHFAKSAEQNGDCPLLRGGFVSGSEKTGIPGLAIVWQLGKSPWHYPKSTAICCRVV